jgi:hypothetical protein
MEQNKENEDGFRNIQIHPSDGYMWEKQYYCGKCLLYLYGSWLVLTKVCET